MSYQLLLHRSVTKFLNKCAKKQREEISEKLEQLKLTPYPGSILDIKVLQGYDKLYRLRVGQYRLIYKIQENELIIFILKAGQRGDIYKSID
jgi:mRNA interferase RelE/StbE